MPLPKNLQDQVDTATASLNNAKSALDSATTAANDKLASLNRCNCGKGKTLGGDCSPLKHQVTFPSLANPADCIDPPNINKCKTDCCSKSTCKNNVQQYNDAVTAYNSANANYVTAKANLQTVLASVASQVGSDPNVILANHQIEADAAVKAQRNKYIFFGIIVIAALVAAYYIFKK